jgi:uncharacterized protein (TIGR02246 family)
VNHTEQARQTDLDAIEQVVSTVEYATRNEMPEEFLSLFRTDAIWTTGGGKRLFGRAEISTFTHQVLPGGMKGKGLTVTMRVEHVLFIRPDVVAVKVRQRYGKLDERPMADEEITFTEGTPMFVMAKEDGRWLLVACQNTEVADGS